MHPVIRLALIAAAAISPAVLGIRTGASADSDFSRQAPVVEAQDKPAEPDPNAERVKGQFDQRLKRLAGDHEDFGKKYKKAGDIPEAIKQYRFAIYLDTDHAQARKAMGYVKRDGRWAIDSLLTPDPEVDESKLTEAEKKKLEEKRKAIEEASSKVAVDVAKHAAKLAKDMLEWHEKLTKVAATELADKALMLAGWFMPDDADVAKARGFVAHRGTFRHPRVAAQIDAAVKTLSESPKGEDVSGADPQAEPLKVGTIHRRRQAERVFMARTTHSAERAARLMQVVLGAEERTRKMVAAEKATAFRQGEFTMTEFKNKSEFSDFIKLYDTSDEKRKEFILKLSGTASSNPFGFVTWHSNSMSGDDMAAHNVAASVLTALRNRSMDPWVARGFGYAVTGQMLGTTSTRFYTIDRPRGRTAVRGDGSDPVFRRERSGPDRMRQVCVEMVILDDDITFHELSKTGVNDMTERHVSKAMSLMEMLLIEKPAELKTWLLESKGPPEGDLKNLLDVLKMEDADLQQMWMEWVLRSY